MTNSIKRIAYYTTIAAATIGAPIISEISGCSNNLAVDAVKQNEAIRNRYPEEMREHYKGVAYDSARYLADVLAVGAGLFIGAGIASKYFKK